VKLRLLDLFCGAGGCTAGCGDQFEQADALELLRVVLDGQIEGYGWGLRGIDAIHASPPCQAYSVLRHTAEKKGKVARGRIVELESGVRA
jgi:site-specific DNA-cytosine methylase